jgi:SAM-dependent methyltransferase
MSELSQTDPLKRFTDLAGVYARCRPDYPAAAMEFIVQHAGLDSRSVVADIGSGTGISSRQLAARGVRVIGVEPNASMRRQAEGEPDHRDRIDYRDGTGEATGLPDASADAVVSAQAFHWFNAEAALREFRRTVKPGGWVALMWNERDESDPATAAYGRIVGSSPEARAVEEPRKAAVLALRRCPLFTNWQERLFAHEQLCDEDGVLGRAFSATYAPKEPAPAARFAEDLRRVFAEFQQGGAFHLRYVTSVDVAQA